MKRFVHSFWTKPSLLRGEEILKGNIWYFATSVAYLKKLGFPIVLHTDTKGKELLEFLPYDEIYTTLDNIPEDINPKFFAYGKFIAMQLEELGNVHIDGDVFIKNKELADRILNFKGDCIVLMIEPEPTVKYTYRQHDFDEASREILKKYDIDLECTTAYNCGIVGINNPELRDKYYNNYLNAVRELCKVNKFEHPYAIPDVVCEQLFLRHLCDNVDLLLTCPLPDWIKVAHSMGFQHIPGFRKYTPELMSLLKESLKTFDINIYNKVIENESKFK